MGKCHAGDDLGNVLFFFAHSLHTLALRGDNYGNHVPLTHIKCYFAYCKSAFAPEQVINER